MAERVTSLTNSSGDFEKRDAGPFTQTLGSRSVTSQGLQAKRSTVNVSFQSGDLLDLQISRPIAAR